MLERGLSVAQSANRRTGSRFGSFYRQNKNDFGLCVAYGSLSLKHIPIAIYSAAMPNDISYPYRPPLISLFIGAFGVVIAVIVGRILLIIPVSKVTAEIWGFFALLGLSMLLLAYTIFTLVVAAYFCWRYKTTITLRRSDIVLPVGFTKRETAIRYDDIAYVEKAYGNRGSVLLRIMPRAGREIMIPETWLPANAFASLLGELQTRKRISERDSDG
jgi:hypothetical protein